MLFFVKNLSGIWLKKLRNSRSCCDDADEAVQSVKDGRLCLEIAPHEYVHKICIMMSLINIHCDVIDSASATEDLKADRIIFQRKAVSDSENTCMR